jgi:predicted MFS family arabinose efflux permease
MIWDDDFASPRARYEYWLWCAATLLAFAATAQLSVLSLILLRAGVAESEIGVILGAWSAPVIPSALLSGWAVRRFGAERVAVVGVGLIFVGFISMQIALGDLYGSVVSRIVQGIGFGVFAPAATTAVKVKLTPKCETYRLGLFSATMMLPQLFSPAFAEAYLSTWGVDGFFVWTSAPILVSLFMVWSIHPNTGSKGATDASGYVALLLDSLLRAPMVAITVTGALWGFVSTLLALLLAAQSTPVACFFTTFGICVLLTRFVLMRRVDEIAPQWAVAMALASMAAGCAMLANSAAPLATMASALLFGGGYSIAYPRVIVWAANQYAEAERPKTIALVNAAFNVGGLLAPLFGGLVMSLVPLSALALGAAVVGSAAAVFVAHAAKRMPISRNV